MLTPFSHRKDDLSMIRGRFLRTGDDLAPVFALRNQIFCRELRFLPTILEDDADAMAIYALVYDDGDDPSATGRLAIENDRLCIGCVCTAPDARNQRLGDLVMRMLLVRVVEMRAPGVFAHCPKVAVAFFSRYGFRPHGPAISVHGRPVIPMYVPLENIDIEGDCHKASSANCQGDCAACQAKCGG